MHNFNSKLVLSLIKAEMKSYRLVKGLKDAGTLTEDFYADLESIIMDLLKVGEAERDELYKVYDEFMEQLSEINVYEFTQELNNLAVELYIRLLAEKKYLEKVKKSA